jgi:hypothetical protein
MPEQNSTIQTDIYSFALMEPILASLGPFQRAKARRAAGLGALER